MRVCRPLLLTMVALSALSVGPVTGQSTGDAAGVDFEWGVKIPLRDGVRVNATVYRPTGARAKLPVIFTLTPYVSDSYHARAMYFAQHGYVYVLVDVRGRGNSGGRFEPMVNEGKDGFDVVEWLAQQSWSNGKVAMWGGSYAGFDQWATLKELPLHLATIVPAAATYPGITFPYSFGIAVPYSLQWSTYTSGATGNVQTFGDNEFWAQQYRKLYFGYLPFRLLDSIAGNRSTQFQTWLAHPNRDAYWDAMVPTPDQYRRMAVPILTITGHYDGDQPGALEYYRQHMRHATVASRDRHFLIIGPWNHAGTRTPERFLHGLDVGAASVLDLNSLHREWYDWTMKGANKPAFLKKHIAYYLTGADEWRYADSLEVVSDRTRILYLSSENGHPTDVFHSGSLSERPPGGAATDSYRYDPLDTRPGELETGASALRLDDFYWGEWPVDQTYPLNLFGAGLVYHSEPLEQDLEIAGQPRLTAWISLNVPDTDFLVSLYEIMRDGRSVLLTSQLQRARYARSDREQTLVTPGTINRYDFTQFQWFARRVAKGSRLRLVFQSPNSIYFGKNYNSGGVVADESQKDAQTAIVTLHHDSSYRTALELPIVSTCDSLCRARQGPQH